MCLDRRPGRSAGGVAEMRLDPQARRELEDALFDALDENELHRVVRRALKVEMASITKEDTLQDALPHRIGLIMGSLVISILGGRS